jgi:hypothetical protein
LSIADTGNALYDGRCSAFWATRVAHHGGTMTTIFAFAWSICLHLQAMTMQKALPMCAPATFSYVGLRAIILSAPMSR